MTEGPERTNVPRRLAAILAADIAGYSALMGADEARTVQDLKEHQAVVLPMIKEHGGRVIDTGGDGILAEFGSVVNAAECAVAIQRTMALRNADVEEARRMRFRIGINQGDVVLMTPASMVTASTSLPVWKALQSPAEFVSPAGSTKTSAARCSLRL
jgi:class 3 adenylate cyclase